MSDDVYIFEVSEKNFGQTVLLNSHKLPVLVEFMGVWSGPCSAMEHVLSGLAKEFAGQFIFAKVDIDEQPGLVKEYSIENVPTLKVFKDGEVVHTEQGQMQEPELRTLLKRFGVFRESDEMREQAREKHMLGDTPGAVVLLTQALQKDSGNTRIAMDMVQIFIDIGQLDEAKSLFNKLPQVDRDGDMGKALSGQLLFLELAGNTQGEAVLSERLAQDAADHDARFDLALCQVAGHRYQEALESLFTILSQQVDFREGAAREMIITLLNMLTPSNPELAQEYRRKLGNMLSG